MDKEILYGIISFFVLQSASLFFNNKKETQENTLAVKGLTVELVHMRELVQKVPKLEDDMDSAHEKIRVLEKRLDG